MTIGRNDPCACGSGRKYKRCCLDRDQAAERERRRIETEPDRLLGRQDSREANWAAVATSVEAITGKDRAALGKRLEDFADLLRTDAALADVRFADAAFDDAVERSLADLGRARGDRARRRLFQLAMAKLGDRRTLQALGDRLARAMNSATLSFPDREAVAAALVCMAPVLERVPLPPDKSPTIEIIFNVQLEGWLARRQSSTAGVSA